MEETDEITSFELQEEASKDIEGNLLSDRFSADFSYKEDMQLPSQITPMVKKRSSTRNAINLLSKRTVIAESDGFLTELDLDYEESRRVSNVSNIAETPDSSNVPNREDISIAENSLFLNDQFASMKETLITASASDSTNSFMTHFDPEIDLSPLTNCLLPISQLKELRQESPWTWNKLLAVLKTQFDQEKYL